MPSSAELRRMAEEAERKERKEKEEAAARELAEYERKKKDAATAKALKEARDKLKPLARNFDTVMYVGETEKHGQTFAEQGVKDDGTTIVKAFVSSQKPHIVIESDYKSNAQYQADKDVSYPMYPKRMVKYFNNKYAEFRKSEKEMPVQGLDEELMKKIEKSWLDYYTEPERDEKYPRKLAVFDWDKVLAVVPNFSFPKGLAKGSKDRTNMVVSAAQYMIGRERLYRLRDFFNKLHASGVEVAVLMRSNSCADDDNKAVMLQIMKMVDPMFRRDNFMS